jgi:hypothetical protein
MKFICPLPIPWHEIYQNLFRAWEQGGREGPPPPLPLILNGWLFSNDADKAQRWAETLEWTEVHGYGNLIPDLHDDEKYIADKTVPYEIGPLGGPMHRSWGLDTKGRPSEQALADTLSRLKVHWSEIVGPELAAHTGPLMFSGRKMRRLLVHADPSFTPPWGSWHHLSENSRRREFTRLRKTINEFISPLEVDHIDFDTSGEVHG